MSSKVLIVDDAMDDLELVNAMLAANGFTVVKARHGRDGLEQDRKHTPDLIISDVLMPEMDGFAFYKELKKDNRTAKIPVLILTVRGRMRDTFDAFGVECFMPKPLNVEALFSVVSKYVTAGASSAVQPKEEKAPTPSAEAAPKPAPPVPVPVQASAEPRLSLSTAKRKALIFGSENHVLEDMVKLLEREKCHGTIIKDESQLPVQVDSMEPDLILLQLNSSTSMPIDRIVSLLNKLIQKKIKASGANAATYQRGNIVLYKVEEEMGGLDSMTASIADTESVLDRCKEEGCKKYIGAFSPVMFLTKVKEFIA